MDLLTPRRSLNSALPLHTQKQCTARRSSWGSSILSLTTKGSWIHIGGEGGGSPSLSSRGMLRQTTNHQPLTNSYVHYTQHQWKLTINSNGQMALVCLQFNILTDFGCSLLLAKAGIQPTQLPFFSEKNRLQFSHLLTRSHKILSYLRGSRMFSWNKKKIKEI